LASLVSINIYYLFTLLYLYIQLYNFITEIKNCIIPVHLLYEKNNNSI